MLEIGTEESVVLKISVSLQTLTGERVAEIDASQVFRDILGDHVPGSPEAAFEEMFDVQVTSPCRALFRAHVLKLREQAGFTRLDHPVGPSVWDQTAEEVVAGLQRRFGAVAAKTEGR